VKEADALDAAQNLLGWQAHSKPFAERNRKTASILGGAADQYDAGIATIEKALEVIGDEADAGKAEG
jgi:hypothetical protein